MKALLAMIETEVVIARQSGLQLDICRNLVRVRVFDLDYGECVWGPYRNLPDKLVRRIYPYHLKYAIVRTFRKDEYFESGALSNF
ncbi:unnamed protein product [Wuchereria bancrofti]|uniref:Uncharacterized protein n=2 Tax=Wuchereria bancrofti TaxID=6293 RepID=A0A3P7FU43_WUCBA|nr:unnamed protein product [Wuchereria bancrofti]